MLAKQLPNFIAGIIAKLGHRSSSLIEDELHDLSYEDALLEVEIRSFMRAEYGRKTPSARVFPRVMRAIRLYQQEQERRTEAGLVSRFGQLVGTLRQAFMSAYRLGSRPSVGRIMSGSMVATLLLLAIGPKMMHFLGSDDQAYGLYIRALSGGRDLQQIDNPATSIQVSPTSLVSARPPASSVGPTLVTEAPPTHISPGTLYDDPRLLLAQRTGENPGELARHYNRQAGDDALGTNDSNQTTSEPDYKRPFVGEY